MQWKKKLKNVLVKSSKISVKMSNIWMTSWRNINWSVFFVDSGWTQIPSMENASSMWGKIALRRSFKLRNIHKKRIWVQDGIFSQNCYHDLPIIIWDIYQINSIKQIMINNISYPCYHHHESHLQLSNFLMYQSTIWSLFLACSAPTSAWPSPQSP